MSRPSFEYPDENGTVLAVEPGPGPAGDISAVSVADMTCYVLAEHRAQVAAGLWTGSGAPAPVILDRPDGQDLNFRAIRIGRNGNAVLLAIGGNQEALSPLLARELAANLVTLAEEADGEPDPAEVEELAALMDAEMDRRANGQSGLYPAVARIALQWMNGRQQRGGERP